MENEGNNERPARPVDPIEAAAAARRAILGRGLRDLRMGIRGGNRRRNGGGLEQAEMLNARAEEQRVSFMEALVRGAEAERREEEGGDDGESSSSSSSDTDEYQ